MVLFAIYVRHGCQLLSVRHTPLGLHYVSFLERCPSYRASTKRSNERQGPTPGVHFSETSSSGVAGDQALHWVKKDKNRRAKRAKR